MGSHQYELNYDSPFLMSIDDVFDVRGRGIILAGTTIRGLVNKGDELELIGGGRNHIKVTASGIESGLQYVSTDNRNDHLSVQHRDPIIRVMLEGVSRNKIKEGMVLAAPGTVRPCANFAGDVLLLPSDLGGKSQPFGSYYDPRIRIYNQIYDCTVMLPHGQEEAQPRSRISLGITLDVPVALDEGTQFILREGLKVVGVGVVTRVLD